MRPNDNYNIITGQSKQHFHSNTHNRRFGSLETIRQLKQTKAQEVHDGVFSYKYRKLGTAQDSKLYQYSYLPKEYNSLNPSSNLQVAAGDTRKKHSEPISLMNASKAQHNLINHSLNHQAAQNWQLTRKKSPVSKFTDLGRIYAPNYSEAYKEESNFGKKMALCTTVCEIQRSYGTDKYFRKFK